MKYFLKLMTFLLIALLSIKIVAENSALEDFLSFARISQVVASPNGKQTAFVTYQIKTIPVGKQWEYYLYVKTQQKINLLIKGQKISSIAWSPDGKQLTYLAKGKNFQSIWFYDIQKQQAHKLVEFTNDINSYKWSPDGKYLVFAADAIKSKKSTALTPIDVSDDYIQERFDLIFCRFLFIHLSQPLIAIQKLKKLLRPGGCLILAELDNATWFSYPENSALHQDTILLCKLGMQKSADFCIGPKLYGYLRQESFNIINVKIAQPVLTTKQREYLVLKSKAWAQAYLDYNLISVTALEVMLQELQGLVNHDDYLIAGAKMYLVCGKNT